MGMVKFEVYGELIAPSVVLGAILFHYLSMLGLKFILVSKEGPTEIGDVVMQLAKLSAVIALSKLSRSIPSSLSMS